MPNPLVDILLTCVRAADCLVGEGGRHEQMTRVRNCIFYGLLAAFLLIILGAGLAHYWYDRYQPHEKHDCPIEPAQLPMGCTLEGGKMELPGGVDMEQKNITDINSCATACAAEEDCRTFRYSNETLLCEMSAQNATEKSDDEEYTSGGCEGKALIGGDGFIQLGDWRMGDTDPIDGGHFAFSQRNQTAMVARSDGFIVTNKSSTGVCVTLSLCVSLSLFLTTLSLIV